MECFFPVITRQAIRRGSCTSVRQLTDTIGAFTGHWNDHPGPFAWTKDADEVLASIQRAKTKNKRSYTPLGRSALGAPPGLGNLGHLGRTIREYCYV